MERTTSGRAELIGFIASAKQTGIGDATLVGILKASGWSENDIYAALRNHCEQQTGLAVPVRRGLAGGARDAFLYLLSFATLGTWIVALGSILFSAIEHFWPDPVLSARSYDSAAASSAHEIAALLVAFPVYLLTTRSIVRYLRDDPEAGESPIRKWLTYLALLIAACVVIGDLITFVAYLLRGELSARFLAKVLVVLILAGGVFWYYLSSLRGAVRHSAFAGAAVVMAAAGLVVGFANLGSPAQQRALQADRVRIEQLRRLAYELQARAGAPPESLDELRSPHMDPLTGASYEYKRLSGARYELCATFAGESRAGFWAHGPGRQCFALDASQPVP
jgi:hypothetical protein